MKIYLNFDGLPEQENIGQQFSMNCSKIGHYEAFT